MTVGYVVVEYNQASHRPNIMDADLLDDQEDAEREAAAKRAEAIRIGRGEQYVVCSVEEVGEDERHDS